MFFGLPIKVWNNFTDNSSKQVHNHWTQVKYCLHQFPSTKHAAWLCYWTWAMMAMNAGYLSDRHFNHHWVGEKHTSDYYASDGKIMTTTVISLVDNQWLKFVFASTRCWCIEILTDIYLIWKLNPPMYFCVTPLCEYSSLNWYRKNL